MTNTPKQSAYARAGVDIEAATEAVRRMKAHVAGTRTAGTLADVGSFGGMFALSALGPLRDPVLVSSMDGVGTKLKIAFATGRHDTIGRDLVWHCVNDILVQGARPLFFLDYLAVGTLVPEVAAEIVKGLADGCRAAHCALIGGETAEMPGMYQSGEYDLAGCIVGLVERDKILDGAAVRPGDSVIGLASDGLHTNGYSLARRVLLEDAGMALDTPVPELGGATLADALLWPHRCYANAVLPLLETAPTPNPSPVGTREGNRNDVLSASPLPFMVEGPGVGVIHALAHITGGGFWDNIPRVLPDGYGVRIRKNAWDVPPLFRLIQTTGGIGEDEMFRVFNMGIGFILIVAPEHQQNIMERLTAAGETAYALGEVVSGAGVEFA